MAEAERVSSLMRQSATTPENSNAHQLSERQLETLTKSILHREKEIENKLMSKCMMQGGYWYVNAPAGNHPDCFDSSKSESDRSNQVAACWGPAPPELTPFAR
jgi:hypothetical protein